PGPALSESAAREVARRTLIERFQSDPASLREVSAEPSKLPARTDWTITFADASRGLAQGEPRLGGRIAGNEVADAWRFVYVPEDWRRGQRNEETALLVVRGLGTLLAAVSMFGGAIAAIVAWSRRRFAVGTFLAVLLMLLTLGGIRLVNGFPAMMVQ